MLLRSRLRSRKKIPPSLENRSVTEVPVHIFRTECGAGKGIQVEWSVSRRPPHFNGTRYIIYIRAPGVGEVHCRPAPAAATSTTTMATPEPAYTAAVPVRLPRIAIHFCTQCKWMLRAAYVSPQPHRSCTRPSNPAAQNQSTPKNCSQLSQPRSAK